MMIRALQTRGVFACHCQIETTCIRVGILLAEENVAERVSLAQTDDFGGDRFEVLIPPDLTIPAYNVILVRPAAV